MKETNKINIKALKKNRKKIIFYSIRRMDGGPNYPSLTRTEMRKQTSRSNQRVDTSTKTSRLDVDGSLLHFLIRSLDNVKARESCGCLPMVSQATNGS